MAAVGMGDEPMTDGAEALGRIAAIAGRMIDCIAELEPHELDALDDIESALRSIEHAHYLAATGGLEDDMMREMAEDQEARDGQ